MRDNARLNFINAGHDNAARTAIQRLYQRHRMNVWRYDEIDTDSTAKFNRCKWTKLHRHRCGSKSNPCTIKIAMLRQQNRAAHGSDTGSGAVKATPQRQNRYHRSRKNSAVIKISVTPRNAIKILAVASAATKLSM